MYNFNECPNEPCSDKYINNTTVIDARRLIAVTNRHLCSRPFQEQVKRVCSLHPKALILREKDLPEGDYLLLADQVLTICKEYEVPCILHSFVSAARTLHAPYLHLPLPLLRELAADTAAHARKPRTTDRCLPLPQNSRILADFREIGTSVHSVEDAIEAEHLGATYLTAGHIYATDCKKGLPPRGLAFLHDVCSHVSIPVYAIGGIHLKTAPGAADSPHPTDALSTENMVCPRLSEVLAQGAAGACVMSDLMRI